VSVKSGLNPTAEKQFETRPQEGFNNIGEQGTTLSGHYWNDFLKEGGGLGKILNVVPGLNSVAGLHDVFQITLSRNINNFARTALNFPGMPVAAAINYSALFNNSGIVPFPEKSWREVKPSSGY